MQMSRLLILGPDLKNGAVGGVTLPFSEFCRYAENDSSSAVQCVEIRPSVSGLFALLKAIFFNESTHVILHATWRAVWSVGALLALTKLIRRKKLVLRKFAGDFDLRYARLPKWKKRLLRAIMKAFDLLYFETEYLVKWGRSQGFSTDWWPNGRIPADGLEISLQSAFPGNLRLIYLGRVCKAKGVTRLAGFSTSSDAAITVDVYGPIEPSEAVELQEYFEANRSWINYCGQLERHQISERLREYDALVLPTSWQSEGYPGVIIEAAMVGVPSLTSHSRGPCELLELLGCGVPVDFDNVDVAAALTEYTSERRLEFQAKARELLSSDTVHSQVMARILAL
jgi:glycosyltransferase involved in cell wall biosynthesis